MRLPTYHFHAWLDRVDEPWRLMALATTVFAILVVNRAIWSDWRAPFWSLLILLVMLADRVIYVHARRGR